jgi:hypothetical protein
VVSLLVSGCGGSDQPGADCAAPTPTSGTARVLREMRLEQFGAVTAVRDEAGLSAATVISDRDIQKLVEPVRAAILEAGYTVLAEENEGFEADFKFNRGEEEHGIARITDVLDCDVRQIQVSVAGSSASASPSPSSSSGASS